MGGRGEVSAEKLEISKEKTLNSSFENMGRFREKIAHLIVAREKQDPRTEATSEESLESYRRQDGGAGLKEYLHRLFLDANTKIKSTLGRGILISTNAGNDAGK